MKLAILLYAAFFLESFPNFERYRVCKLHFVASFDRFRFLLPPCSRSLVRYWLAVKVVGHLNGPVFANRVLDRFDGDLLVSQFEEEPIVIAAR